MAEGHISYEINMLSHAYLAWNAAPDDYWQTLLLENILIHGRVLLEFLFAPDKKHRRPGDIFAFHFVKQGEAAWERVCRRDQALQLFGHEIRDLHRKISASLGHLTIGRRDKPAWRPLLLIHLIAPLLILWEDHLEADARQVWSALDGFSDRASFLRSLNPVTPDDLTVFFSTLATDE
jgi:hypothetical protein